MRPLCNGPKALLAPCHTLEPPRTQIPLVPVAPLAKDGAAVINMVANATVMMTNAVFARFTSGPPLHAVLTTCCAKRIRPETNHGRACRLAGQGRFASATCQVPDCESRAGPDRHGWVRPCSRWSEPVQP